MRPLSLTLYNIGPFFGKCSIDFLKYNGIFLVAGDTGAGKTTIFDAMTYSLYGNTLSKKDPRMLRTDYVSPDTEASVEFIFSLMEQGTDKRYKVIRTLPLGSKAETCALFIQNDDGEFEQFIAGKYDTDKKIESIIGLKFDEFIKIILLPQGEFANFIKSRSKEKEAILKEIFDVNHVVNFIQAVADEVKNKKYEIESVENQLNSLAETYNDNSYESTITELTGLLSKMNAEVKNCEAKKEKLLQEKIQGQSIAKKVEQLKDEKDKFEKLQLDKNKIENLQEQVNTARAVVPLVYKLNEIKALGDRRDKLADEQTKLQEQQKNETAQLASLTEKKAIADIERKETERDQLITKIDKQKEALTVYAEISKANELYGELQTQLQPKQQEITVIKEKIQQLKGDNQALDYEIAQRETRQKQYDEAKDKKDTITALLKLLTEKDEKQKIQNASATSISSLTDQLRTIEHDTDIETANLQTYQDKKNNQLIQNAATQLAKNLQENIPCPVCGSLTHPKPAVNPLENFSYDELIDKSNRVLERLSKDKINVTKALSAAQAKYDTIAADINRITDEIDLLPKIISADLNELNKLQQACIVEINEAVKQMSRSTQAETKKRENEQRIASFEAQFTELQHTVEELQHKILELQSEIKTKRSIVEKSTDLDGAVDFDITKYKAKIEKDEIHKTKLTNAINEYHKTVQQLEIKTAEQERRIKDNETKISDLSRQYAELQMIFHKEAERRGIDVNRIDELYLDDETIAQFTKQIDEFNLEFIATGEKLKSLEKELEGVNIIDLEKTETDLQNLEKTIDELRERSKDIQVNVQQQKDLHSRYVKLSEAYEAVLKKTEKIKNLYDKISGNNAKNLKFDTWHLTHLFYQVIMHANTRFMNITDERYSLQITDQAQSKRALSGLDLLVYDAYTGKTRPTVTLSGGETFIASVCIALGLADTITGNAGGIKIDSMFIDEGFGSLDSENLEKVFSALQKITDDESLKLLGIISHVGELGYKIAQKLSVIKTNSGSKIVQE